MFFTHVYGGLKGAAFVAMAATVGAGIGEVFAPGSPFSTVLELTVALGAAMAWVDRRIQSKLEDFGEIQDAKAVQRDETLLRKVEEMLR